MKGTMASREEVMVRSLMAALYPDTLYAHNSGGAPLEITRLTRDRLKTFHLRHYHLGNAFFYTCGNLPLDKHLAFIEQQVLGEFDGREPGTEVPNQPRWREPRSVRHPYPLSVHETRRENISSAWPG